MAEEMESSDLQEQNQENATQSTVTGNPNLTGKALYFDRVSRFKRHISILDGDKQVYFSNFSPLKPKKPEIVLHRSTKDGPVCGVSHLRMSRHSMLGLGSEETSMQWIEMRATSPIPTSKYEIEWEGKTHSVHLIKKAERHGMGLQKTLFAHFKVVDDSSQEIVGLYISEPGISGKGTLHLKEGLSADLEVLILLELISWREKRK